MALLLGLALGCLVRDSLPGVLAAFLPSFAAPHNQALILEESPEARSARARARLARPALSRWVRDNVRVTMETHPWPTGGPEACVQLMHSLASLGVALKHLTVTEDVSSMIFEPYTRGMRVWAGEHARGDISITTESVGCPIHGSRGVRQLSYLLSDCCPLKDSQSECAWVGHSHWTRNMRASAPRAIVHGYASPVYLEVAPTTIADVASKKVPLVLIDNDCPHEAALRAGLAAGRYPHAEVVVLKGWTRDEMRLHYTRAMAIVECNMPGMERVPLEASLFWVVPLLEHAGRSGEDAVDFPVPAAYGWSDDARMVANVERVFDNWTLAAADVAPLRLTNMRNRDASVTDVARLFESAGLDVHVAACGSGARELGPALLVAAAAHLAAPLAAVTLHVGNGSACDALPACARASSGGALSLFRYAGIVRNSPLCAAGADTASVAAALEPYGPAEHHALLSWRALPLEAPALTGWQAASRNASGFVACSAVPLFVPSSDHKGSHTAAHHALGVMLAGAHAALPRRRITFDAGDGSFTPPTPAPCSSFKAQAGGPVGPAFLDLAEVLVGGGVGKDERCELVGDEATQDLVSLLEDGGQPVPLDAAPAMLSCLRSGKPAPLTQQLCANQRFSLLSTELGLHSRLCS